MVVQLIVVAFITVSAKHTHMPHYQFPSMVLVLSGTMV